MDRKTVDRILKAVDDQFPIFEANNWDEAMKITEKTFKWFLDNLRNRSQLEAIFCEASEPTPDELEDILYNIEHGAGILRRLFMAFVKKDMPPDPGGRPRKLGTPEERTRRVRQVIWFIEKGLGTTEALRRVARLENLSLSRKNFSPRNRNPRDGRGLTIRFYEIDRYLAVPGAQNTRRNFDNPGERRRVTNRPDAFRPVSSKRYRVLRSIECARQGLTFLWAKGFAAITFHVKGAVEVITRVNIRAIRTRQQDEELALRRTPNPQSQPEISALSDRYRVPVLT